MHLLHISLFPAKTRVSSRFYLRMLHSENLYSCSTYTFWNILYFMNALNWNIPQNNNAMQNCSWNLNENLRSVNIVSVIFIPITDLYSLFCLNKTPKIMIFYPYEYTMIFSLSRHLCGWHPEDVMGFPRNALFRFVSKTVDSLCHWCV